MIASAIKIDVKRCKKCGICAAYCKLNVLSFDKENPPTVDDISKCVVCRLCENICPDLAIEVEAAK